MISYELAQQLKNAGFPQKEPNQILKHSSVGFSTSQPDMFYIPSLSELIEECIKYTHEMTFHLENIKDNIKWWAEMRHFGILIFQTKGSTPEEAIALLWLELKNK